MSGQLYNWKRFWYPAGTDLDLDGGFLPDPDSDWGRVFAPHLVPLEAITDVQCLILLGEPGIGKTTGMEAARQAIDTQVEAERGKTVWLNLRSYSSENSPVWKFR